MLATSTGTGSLSGSFVISNQITSEEHEVLPPEYANFRKYQAVRGKLVTGRVWTSDGSKDVVQHIGTPWKMIPISPAERN